MKEKPPRGGVTLGGHLGGVDAGALRLPQLIQSGFAAYSVDLRQPEGRAGTARPPLVYPHFDRVEKIRGGSTGTLVERYAHPIATLPDDATGQHQPILGYLKREGFRLTDMAHQICKL